MGGVVLLLLKSVEGGLIGNFDIEIESKLKYW